MTKNSLREKLRFLLIDSEILSGKITDIAIIIFNFLVCILFVIETYSHSDAVRHTL